MRLTCFLIPYVVATSSLAYASSNPSYDLRAETGFLGVQNHRIKLSEGNTYFDYVEDGSQDVLFSYQRYTAEILWAGDALAKFVYQPLDLQTTSVLTEDLVVENEVFSAGTPMEYGYSFPYYRASYLWNLVSSNTLQLYGGLGLQIRNATIRFATRDGTKQVEVRDVGPVPLFSLLSLVKLTDSTTLAFEAEGNYANTAFINGDDEDAVTGAIVDTAVSFDTKVNDKITGFSTFRYVSGGAEGKSDERDTATGDGYNSNWLDLMAFSLGLSLHLDKW